MPHRHRTSRRVIPELKLFLAKKSEGLCYGITPPSEERSLLPRESVPSSAVRDPSKFWTFSLSSLRSQTQAMVSKSFETVAKSGSCSMFNLPSSAGVFLVALLWFFHEALILNILLDVSFQNLPVCYRFSIHRSVSGAGRNWQSRSQKLEGNLARSETKQVENCAPGESVGRSGLERRSGWRHFILRLLTVGQCRQCSTSQSVICQTGLIWVLLWSWWCSLRVLKTGDQVMELT